MTELHADDSYTITGRGQAFSFRAGALLAAGVRNPKDLINKAVIIDGTSYIVKGVEHWAIVCDGECGHPVGLLVAPVESPFGVHAAPGPDGVVCAHGCDAWSISSACEQHAQ